MQIKTSKGNEYEVIWAGKSLSTPDQCIVQMQDDRRLPEIAAEFDGLETMEASGMPGQADQKLLGYTSLVNIARQGNGAVLIVIRRE